MFLGFKKNLSILSIGIFCSKDKKKMLVKRLWSGLNIYLNIKHWRWNIMDGYLKHAIRQGSIDKVVLYQYTYIFCNWSSSSKWSKHKRFRINADEIKSKHHAAVKDHLLQLHAVCFLFRSIYYHPSYMYVTTKDPK